MKSGINRLSQQSNKDKWIIPLFFAVLFILAVISSAEGAARWPAEPNPSLLSVSGKLKADLSNASEGYFLASLTSANPHKMKLRVTKGDETLTYDLNGEAKFEVFPFQLGSGFYDISLYENVSGKKYAQAGNVALNVNLNREDVAFLYPNQYVNYNELSAAVADAEKLCAGKSDREIFDILCEYMKTSFVYDYIRAATVQAGALPDIDGSYKKRMGICQDLSAIFCCMMRSQGLPARLIIGYADKQYHAWTITEIDGREYFFDPTAALNAISKVKDYSMERFY